MSAKTLPVKLDRAINVNVTTDAPENPISHPTTDNPQLEMRGIIQIIIEYIILQSNRTSCDSVSAGSRVTVCEYRLFISVSSAVGSQPHLHSGTLS